jgi:hypothetical protein
MIVDKLRIIAWIFAAILVSGLYMILAGKVPHAPLAIVHKLLALLCLVLLLRSAGALRAFAAPPALTAAILVFAVAYLAAFATGVIQSIPACASSVWLNMHRITAAAAAVACAVSARLIALTVHT